MKRLNITLHAISRWRERRYDWQDKRIRSDDEVRVEIGKALLRSRRVRLRNEAERARKALTHGAFATYQHWSNVIIVVSDNTVLTVYAYEGARWEETKP